MEPTIKEVSFEELRGDDLVIVTADNGKCRLLLRQSTWYKDYLVNHEGGTYPKTVFDKFYLVTLPSPA